MTSWLMRVVAQGAGPHIRNGCILPGKEKGAALGSADKNWADLHEEMYAAREAWRQNPLARRLVGMVTAYVVGNGITLRSEYKPLQRFIDDFWQLNQLDQRIPEWCDELCRSGEIFPALFTNPVSRMSTVRAVPASIIERIEWWFSPLYGSATDLATPIMLAGANGV